MIRNKQNLLLTLIFIMSVFLFLGTILSPIFAYGSEISLQSPWDVSVVVVHGKDKFCYRLSNYVDTANKSVAYLGKFAKMHLYHQLKSMELPDDAIYEYIFSGFTYLLNRFSYVRTEKVDARVHFDGGFTYIEGNDGVDIDKYQLFQLFLCGVGQKTTVELPLKYDKAVTVEQLKEKTVLKGKFTTSFYSSGTNRCFNIQKCCGSLNGCIINDGEKFSFNDIVGPRTEEAGYKNAVVINQGKYVEGVGGGVCQVSTTLYNALLLANFIPSANKHTLACSYVEPGFDAMVAYGSSDLTFVNDSGCPVYISAKVVDKTVTFSIYGKKNDYSVRRESEFVKTPFDTIYVSDKTLADGEEKIISNGSDGISAKAYLTYFVGEKQVKRLLIRSDVYKKVDKIIYRNDSCGVSEERF